MPFLSGSTTAPMSDLFWSQQAKEIQANNQCLEGERGLGKSGDSIGGHQFCLVVSWASWIRDQIFKSVYTVFNGWWIFFFWFLGSVLQAIGVIYAGDAGDMSPPLFEMANFVPHHTPHRGRSPNVFFFLIWKKCSHHFSKQSDALAPSAYNFK